MPALAINGVELPVAIDSLRLTLEAVGSRSRNTRGHALLERRRAKWVYEFELSPSSLDEAMMYRALILGEGEYWNCISSAYGSKGLLLGGSGAWVNASGNPISTNGVFLTDAGQTLQVPGRLYSQAAVFPGPSATGHTVIGWHQDVVGPVWRIFGFSWRDQDTTPRVTREKLGALGSSGAAGAWTAPDTIAVSSGNLVITAATNSKKWSNLYLLPWCLPPAQVDALLDGFAGIGYPLAQLPRVYVQTDLLPDDQLKASPVGLVKNAMACIGEVSEMPMVPLARNGAWSLSDLRLSGTLTEV